MKIMEQSTLCRICLAKGVRMCDVVNTNLQEIYESLTAMQFETKNSRPSQVCYLCCAQLQTCHRLRSKCLQSEELFCQVSDNSELKLASLHNVAPLLTIQLLTHFSIVPVSADITDTDVKDEEDDPSLDCSNIIDNVQVKEEHVEVEDLFDADGATIVDDYDENNVYEAEDIILPSGTISNSGLKAPVDSRDAVCQRLTHFSVVPVSADITDTDVKDEEDDDPSLDCSNIIDNVKVKVEHVEGTEDVFDADEATIKDYNDENNVYEAEYIILPSSTISNSDLKTPLDSRDDVCPKTVKIVLDKLELTNIGTSVPAPIELRFTERVNKTVSEKAEFKDSSEDYINKTGYFSSELHTSITDRPHKCDICGKFFKRKMYLVKHAQLHTDITAYGCDMCGKYFKRRAYLSSHLLTHTDIKPFECDNCGKGFRRKKQLPRHMLTHSNIKPYACDICGKYYTTKYCLSSHMATHSNIKPYVCDICGKCFKKKKYLIDHARFHIDIKTYRCDICGKDFKRKACLSSHLLTHTDIKPYACDNCGKGFQRKTELSRHMLTHSGIRAYACDICGKDFKRKEYLSSHMSVHSNLKPYACDICGKDFKRRLHLTNHIVTHTSIRAYACDICGKDFKRRRYLTNHIVTHTSIRAYACDICGKDFKRKHNLSSHILKHMHIGTCYVCGKDFKTKDRLLSHMLTHSGIKP